MSVIPDPFLSVLPGCVVYKYQNIAWICYLIQLVFETGMSLFEATARSDRIDPLLVIFLLTLYMAISKGPVSLNK